MHNPSKVRSFFERMSSSISSSDSPPLDMLHATRPVAPAYVTGSLQNMVAAGEQRTSSMQWEIHDFGVGLPPLAEC